MKPEIDLKINQIIPRIEERLKTDILNDKYLRIPITLCYAEDLDKYIIIDGHHRFFQLKKKGISSIKGIILKKQKQTKFKNNNPLIKW